jgi:predicted metal-dependent enzyme (double-stranded beta helix superfamily)
VNDLRAPAVGRRQIDGHLTGNGSVGLPFLIGSMDELVATESDTSTVAARAASLLRHVLHDPALLADRHVRPHADRYRQHVVHVDPEGRYSLVSLVWRPGQATPIHDHRCWCVVGVWRGSELETRYGLVEDGKREFLLVRGSSTSHAGDVSVLVPPEENIHRVENCGDGLAVSLHVYGADIGALGSSINRVFGQPVAPGPRADAGLVAWRTREADARPSTTERS